MRLNILAFALGILLLQWQSALPDWHWWAVAGLVLALPRWLSVNWPVRIAAALGCLCLGIAWASWRADSRLADELGAEWEGRDVEVVGVVAGLPQEFGQGTRFEFDVNFRLTVGATVPARIMLSWYQGQRDGESFERLVVRPGERWQFTVRLKRPHGNANPGGFDYEAWLLERGIRATGYIRPALPQHLEEMVWQPAYVVERLRHWVRESFQRLLPEERHPWAGVLVALAIGDQKAINVVV